MTLDYFDSRILIGVLRKRTPKPGLIREIFFRSRSPQPRSLFEFHVETKKRSIVPFVSDIQAAAVVQGGEGEAIWYKAPRIRLKRPFAAVEAEQNVAGMTPYDIETNLIERAIADQMQEFRDDIEYTIEYMCAMLATQGRLDIRDIVDGKATTVYKVDFKRDPAHTIDISASATDKWSAAKSDIVEQTEDWAQKIADATGQGATDLVLGKTAWKHFRKHPDVVDNLDNRRIEMGHLSPRVQSLWKGHWNGLDIWVYPNKVTDRTAATAALVPEDSILLGTRDCGQDIEWGMPLDKKCTGPTDFFAKTYDEEDPSQTWALVETRPFPWTKNPDAFVFAKVL